MIKNELYYFRKHFISYSLLAKNVYFCWKLNNNHNYYIYHIILYYISAFFYIFISINEIVLLFNICTGPSWMVTWYLWLMYTSMTISQSWFSGESSTSWKTATEMYGNANWYSSGVTDFSVCCSELFFMKKQLPMELEKACCLLMHTS